MTARARVDIADYGRERFRFFTETPTRWGDCDHFGHINNVQFVRYFESGRLDYFQRLLKLDTGPQVTSSLIIADIHVSFLRQINHPCALVVGSRISRLGRSSFDFEAALFAPDEDEPHATAAATCVWFNFRDNRSEPIPPAERAFIEQFEGIKT